MTTQLELGWLAGIIDGEGSIVFTRRGRFRRPMVQVASCDLEILEECKRLCGGYIVPKKIYDDSHTPAFIWTLNGGQKVRDLLFEVGPHLKCPKKKRRADAILKEYIVRRDGRYTPEEIKKKRLFEERFFEL